MRPSARKRDGVVRVVGLSFALLAACDGNLKGGGGSQAGAPFGTGGAISVASDASGKRLVAVVTGGGIWTSTDAGATWIDRAPSGPLHSQQWMSVASDATGTNLVAVVNGFHDLPADDPADFSGDVWTSNDSGITWTDRTATSDAHGGAWTSVASDASGTNLVAVTKGGGVVLGSGSIWRSRDAGLNWTNMSPGAGAAGPLDWEAVASDASGKNLVAVGGSGVWTSSDGAASWTNHTPADPRFEAAFGDQMEGWWSVASDATGARLVAGVDGGDIWTSTDAGLTWTDRGPTPSWQTWFSLASDATGTNLAAISAFADGPNGEIWTSADGGATWTDRTTGNAAATGPWTAVASNAAGDHVVAVGPNAVWTN